MERLKQKVAASSSRVIASLQQAATGNFQPAHQQQQQQDGSEVGVPAARLLSGDAAAHLTEEEREILLEVFRKEEQFKRDTIKQLGAARGHRSGQRPTGGNAAPSPLSSSSSSSTPHSSAGPSAATQHARSATPSSVFAARPSRAPSSCSSSAASKAGQAPRDESGTPTGQCRICRKLIPANETCHLCSACDQFVCDDCSSYSATDQHWMCSSCRRRATKPAIPADALRELGLNQNSSALRRMTLRLNQAELRRALAKAPGNGSSAASSSSSSGCSSAPTTTNSARCPPVGRPTGTPEVGAPKADASLVARPTSGDRNQASHGANNNNNNNDASNQGESGAQQITTGEPSMGLSKLGGPHCDRRSRNDETQRRDSGPATGHRQEAQKTLSQPLDAAERPSKRGQNRNHQPEEGLPALNRKSSQSRLPQPQQQLLDRRASAAASLANLSSSAAQTGTGSGPEQMIAGAAKSHVQVTHYSAANLPLSGYQRQATGSTTDQVLNYAQGHSGPQPQTLVTASSDLSLSGDSSRRRSTSGIDDSLQRADQQPSHQLGSTLIPIPPDQIHLRRLSDQSNLVRRSSIISETVDASLLARNRSHSNIDTIESLSYLYQQQQQQQQRHRSSISYGPLQGSQYVVQPAPPERPRVPATRGLSTEDEPRHSSLSVSVQQRRPSDQWVLQQHVAAQQEALSYSAREYQEHLAQNRMASIVTPYKQKRRQDSRDEMRSSSSSDLDDDSRGGHMQQQQQQHHFPYQNHQAPMPIPSVSVSEFSSSQQRLNLINSSQQQHPVYDRITPTQINLAIEQAIQQQQLQQGRRLSGDQSLASSSRRGSSSGRLLPRIPGEQSRSLLDLPYNRASNQQLANGSAGDGSALGVNGAGGSNQGLSRLDLPSPGSGVRRASAPEGQNIKIVVDDLDGANGQGAGRHRQQHQQKGSELLERLILYRDDSLDPNTGMAHGFGLQVMGGKLADSGKLEALVSWVLPGGPADRVGLRAGDKIVEWDGKCLVNMSYEQVADVIESSANIAELLVKPAQRLHDGQGQVLVRTQRRMSQQTERDLQRLQKQPTGGRDLNGLANSSHQHHKASTGSLVAMDGHWPDVAANQRAGTGRRLPQIPGLNLPASDNSSAGVRSSHQNGHLLGTQNYSQQHSLSTGELYPQNSTGQLPAAALSAEVLNQVQQQRWPMAGGQLRGGQVMVNGHQQQMGSGEVCGLIGLQVNVDERVGQLEVSVLSAINIDKNPCLDYMVRVRILPESERFKACTTQPSCDMNWKETFIFQNFPVQQLHRMALEIGIWVHNESARLTAHKSQPICEALIPIHSARDRNTDFWPLRPPPGSPQSRRKSLNDLMEGPLLIGGCAPPIVGAGPHEIQNTHNLEAGQYQASDYIGGSALQIRDQWAIMPSGLTQRGLSNSSRNLPDTNRVRLQPRRASDEAAGSAGQRLMSARASPATSRRSIAGINLDEDSCQLLGLGTAGARLVAAAAARGSGTASGGQTQAQMATRLASTQRQLEQLVQQVPSDSPTDKKLNGGRRFSLIGVQASTGYRSQRNSQSGSTDQESPRSKWAPQLQQQPQQTAEVTKQKAAVASAVQQHRGSITGGSRASSGSGSRRGSMEQAYQQQCGQRKGSFAMQTLRKLKRTMSLTKGGEQESEVNRDSRRSSSASTDSQREDNNEDLGLSRRLLVHKRFVGRLKVSFVLTKGQLEIDVICGQGLQFETEFCMGIYVKMYLKGKNRNNKRKTRIVPPAEAPIFKQLIKYDGSLVDNKALNISVWQKQAGLRGKVPIGFTEVRLAELNLEQLQTSWYNLQPMEIACNSSQED